jgi:hypothetical protein
MYRYSIIYVPIWGNFTRSCEYVMASNKSKLYLSFMVQRLVKIVVEYYTLINVSYEEK